MSASVRVQFEPRDLWVGLFFRRQGPRDLYDAVKVGPLRTLTLYVCIIPTLPIVVTIRTKEREQEEWIDARTGRPPRVAKGTFECPGCGRAPGARHVVRCPTLPPTLTGLM